MSWPPEKSGFTADFYSDSCNMKTFLSTLLTGIKNLQESHVERVHLLVNSFGQDQVYGVTAVRAYTFTICCENTDKIMLILFK